MDQRGKRRTARFSSTKRGLFSNVSGSCQFTQHPQFEPRSPRSSLISFTPRQRHLGEAAKTAETSNFKNTVGSLKRLVGRSLSDPEIAEFEKKFINAELVDVNGTVGVKVGVTTI